MFVTLTDRLVDAQHALNFSVKLGQLINETLEPYRDLVEWTVNLGWSPEATQELLRRAREDSNAGDGIPEERR